MTSPSEDKAPPAPGQWQERGNDSPDEGGLDYRLLHSLLAAAELQLEVRDRVDSTNARLMDLGTPHRMALVAAAQEAGRGRRGRGWLSPPGGLYLSLGWHFQSSLTGLSALGLVAGLSAAEALSARCGVDVRVKWPNDLVVGGAKLGGCLVEASGSSRKPARAVIGVGVNLQLPEETVIDQPWTSLAAHAPLVAREQLLADILLRLAGALEQYDRLGFAPFVARWSRLDALAGCPVEVFHGAEGRTGGVAEGVDEQGQLKVRGNGTLHCFNAGEVSVRGK